MRIGINGSGLLTNPDVGRITADIQQAEADGFSSYWVAQTGLVDAITVFAGHGNTGSSMELGTAVVPTWPQHPSVLAGHALTTQALTGNRVIVGIGLAHEVSVTGQWKMTWEKPVRQMIDFLDILQPLLAEGKANHDGYFWSYAGAAARPAGATTPKVMVAALGEQMLKLAGTRTDGTILWCVGPKTVEDHIAPIINDAAAAADRPAPAIVCSIPVWVTDTPDDARAFLENALSIYSQLPSYRAMMDIEGVHGLGDLSIVGSEQEVLDGIAAVAASGATDFTAVPMGADPDERARTHAVLTQANAG